MRWDWSKVKVKLVASIAGKHDGWEQVIKTGHPALMGALQELGAQPLKGKQLVLECQVCNHRLLHPCSRWGSLANLIEPFGTGVHRVRALDLILPNG